MDMNKVELNDMMQEQIFGGLVHKTQRTRPGQAFFHDGCGGIIDNPWFDYAVCLKCGEKHWFLDSFKYHLNE